MRATWLAMVMVDEMEATVTKTKMKTTKLAAVT